MARFAIERVAQKVIEITGSKSALKFMPLRLDDPKQLQPDIRLAESCLQWSPSTPLKQGLLHTIAYFERELNSGSFQ